MTISFTISGVPLLNQLSEPTSDGLPDENARWNCVFASNAALATAYLHRAFNADQLKDSDPHYGQGYVGTASETNLMDTMKALGIRITRMSCATQEAMIAALHTEIAQGHGCIVTMPSQWGTAPANPRTYSGPSHVGLMCGVGDGWLRCMNPWGGFWQDQPDSWWAARLLEGEIWVGSMIIPQGWTDNETLNNGTLTAPNGVIVVRGFRAYILLNGWDAANWPLKPESAVASVEPGNPSIGPGSRQDFRTASLGYTTTKGVYRIWTGQDILALESQLASVQSQLAQAQAFGQVAQNKLAAISKVLSS